MIEVRLFAAARDAAAGESVIHVDATDVPSLNAALSNRFGDRMTQVLTVSSLVSAGVRLSPADPVPPGATVDILPPFAGG